jgi:signal transduction histidine kinase
MRSWQRQLLVELAIGVPLGVFIGAFITLAKADLQAPDSGRTLALTIGYSLCIGLTIQGLIESGRFALARWQRARQGGNDAARHDWPGWTLMLPWTLASAAVGYLAGAALADRLFGGRHLAEVLGGHLQPVAMLFVITLVASLVTVMFFYGRGRLAATEAAARHAEQLATETRLRLLESQLEPHMLFNTLANLRVLITLDPPRAQAMLDRLIAFLRATLAASRRGQQTLGDELQRLDDYLELMKVRMGERLQTRFDVPAELASLAVPALLLQPLVENAIQHGLEPKVAGGRLELRVRREEDRLCITVRDTGVGCDPAAARAASGFGLQQVRDRLAALYGPAGQLELSAAADADGGTQVTVRLPAAPVPATAAGIDPTAPTDPSAAAPREAAA